MKTLIALLLSTNLIGQIKDNVLHVYSGTIITLGTSEILQQCNVKPRNAVMIGFAAGIFAGAAKEIIWDKEMRRGTSDKMDFFNTCWGSLIGVAIEIPIIDIKNKFKK